MEGAAAARPPEPDWPEDGPAPGEVPGPGETGLALSGFAAGWGRTRAGTLAAAGGLSLAIVAAFLVTVLTGGSEPARAVSATAVRVAEASGFPGGATALTETHGDWTVSCRQTDSGKTCSVLQQQLDNQSRQRVVGIELTPPAGDDPAAGTLVLPFGLLLDRGISLRTDNASLSEDLPFRTCLPTGCLVPLSFDRPALTTLGAAAALNVAATAADSGREVEFRLSLAGFAAALARAGELLR